jgi:hypothetical protein
MFGGILQVFAEKSPATVIAQGVLERFLNAEKIDDWFENTSENQYTRKILFSSILSIMLQVVCRVRSNVHSAYLDSDVKASRIALYDKLKNIELKTSRELVQYMAGEAAELIREVKASNKAILPGYRIKYLDGNCIEAMEHRIQVLRDTTTGTLPAKPLVIFDPELELAIDVIPCETGYALERSLLTAVLDTVKKNDLIVADRNFCVLSFLFGISLAEGYFAIRQRKSPPYKSLSEMVFIGSTDTGKVYEEKVQFIYDDKELEARRVIVKLNNPTPGGKSEIAILSNLPEEATDAIKIAEIYRGIWGIETAFQKLEKYLNSELNIIGYPKAALFSFCTALVAFNVYAVVMAAIRGAHPDINLNDEISEHYAEDLNP